MEKLRLAQRCEGFVRYEDPGNIAAPVVESSSYQSDVSRFARTDYAEEDRQRRLEERIRKQRRVELWRQSADEREKHIEEERENAMKREQERLEQLQRKGCKKNMSGETYDPITHIPDRKYQDEYENEVRLAEQRAEARRRTLAERANGSYNPVTGEPYPWAK